jgi:hypothetical protein
VFTTLGRAQDRGSFSGISARAELEQEFAESWPALEEELERYLAEVMPEIERSLAESLDELRSQGFEI